MSKNKKGVMNIFKKLGVDESDSAVKKMKIVFTKKKTAEHPNQSLESTSQVSFEPPDPFAK